MSRFGARAKRGAGRKRQMGTQIVKFAGEVRDGKVVGTWGGGALPYVWGGGHGSKAGPTYGTCVGYTGSIQPCPADTTIGLDCSGFARWMYKLAYGVDVLGSGSTKSQIKKLYKVTTPRPGDLIYFGGTPDTVHHVGIYISSGRMINALRTGTDVREDNISVMSDFLGYYRL